MSEAFFLAGYAANACVSSLPGNVVVSSENGLFPKLQLQNGRSFEPFRFGDTTAPEMEFDLNRIGNGGFETSANGVFPVLWNGNGVGSPITSTTTSSVGTKSCRLTAANEGIYQEIEVPAESTHRVTVDLRGDGSDPINAYLVNVNSGRYVNSSGTWSNTKTTFASRSAATFNTTAGTVTVEAAGPGHYGPVRLRLIIERPGSVTAAAYVDEAYIWPETTLAALVYDTLPTSHAIAVESATDAAFTASLTDHGDLPANSFRRYLKFAPLATPHRYYRFIGTELPIIAPWVSQPILGEAIVLSANPDLPYRITRSMDQGGTRKAPANRSDVPQYEMSASWQADDDALTEVAERLVGGSLHGAEPVFFVADGTRAEFVYGRGGDLATFESQRLNVDVHSYSLAFSDDDFKVSSK